MKKFLNLFAIIVCITIFASSTATAQFSIVNNTDCTIRVNIDYGIGCSYTGTFMADVDANTTKSTSFPGFSAPYASDGGYYNGTLFCPYDVDLCGGGAVDIVTCSATPCQSYTATLTSGSIVFED